MLKINVSTAEAVIMETELITSGRKGLRCAFTFSDDWAGLAKTVIVQGAATRDIALLATNEITVPAECVDKAQFPLKIGVYGAKPDGTIAIPTVWASFGKVLPGAKPSDIPPDELTQDVVAQIQEAANNALYLARNVQSMADSGALDGVSPAVTVTSITGGHNVKITDRDHPDGQDFDVPDGQDGEDGEDGNGIWWTVSRITSTGVPGYGEIRASYLKGRSGTPAAHDLVIGPAIGDSGSIAELYEISSVATGTCALKDIGSLKGAPGAPGDPGADGYAPEVTIEQIDGGHRVTITSADYPDGQSFDVMNGQGGGGGITVDDEISTTSENPVQNKVIKAALDGKGTYSKPSGGIPASDLEEAVQTSLGKADDALPASGNAYRTVSIPMGQLDSTSTATAMTATVPGITELRDGVCVWLKNGVITSASGVTLNINSLGAKPIYNSLSGTVVTTTFAEASTYLFVYNSTRVNGGCWDMVYGYDTNTTYTPVKLGFGYATCSTAVATAAKTAALSSYTLTTGGIVAVKFTNAVPAGATLNINSKGAKAIYYKGAAITAGVIKAGDTVTMIYSTYYHVLSIDRDVDTLPPSPSDRLPSNVSTSTDSAGTSEDYARADHVHYISTTEIFENAVPVVDKLILPSGATNGATVILRVEHTGESYLLYDVITVRNHIAYFLIPLVQNPQDLNDFQVVSDASVSKAYATANGLGLQFNGIADGKLYSAEFVLPFDSNQATGTLSVTDLALPSAQGVSF